MLQLWNRKQDIATNIPSLKIWVSHYEGGSLKKIPMEEEMSSMVLTAKVNAIEESSDSNRSSYSTLACNRSMSNHNVLWTKFKGVVPQHNGHWGAQIYANHQRVWLGTFKSEKDAAMAYDSAAMKLRGGDFHRNFPWTNDTVQEPIFQSQFSEEAILNMIKDGSYPSKFAEFLRNRRHEKEIGLNLSTVCGNRWCSCRLLFQKELTPSDVGKLNRFVVPKKYAVKYFPDIDEGTEDVQLGFHDRQMRLWKFRYCYWKSSQSYVFTRGWNRFVKEQNLKANDVVSFYECEGGEGANSQMYWIVEVGYKDATSSGGMVEMEVDLHLRLEQNAHFGLAKDEKEVFDQDQKPVGSSPAANLEKKGFRLFGFHINV
ncbi:unnamed protein product [Ilex paraguariensis]|uniref:AP2/ERF and B3 domain-containing transcription factor n=1 Tax=Ilex paraguariensis TaxID=185542 RepID=A0ABC8TR24_9AQUA